MGPFDCVYKLAQIWLGSILSASEASNPFSNSSLIVCNKPKTETMPTTLGHEIPVPTTCKYAYFHLLYD